MAKINNKGVYPLEDLPSLLDFLIGSKDKNGKTKNFSLQSIINLINGVNGKNVIQYKFFNESVPDVDYTTLGAMFTNNNETDVNNFSSLILNKSTLGNYDLTILFDFLIDIADLFIGLENPADPNNFFTFKINGITNHDDYFIFEVEPYNGMYIGELVHEEIYSFYWETKEWISEIDNINDELDSKLNHGGYTGTGQDLKNEIDYINSDLNTNYYTKPEVDAKVSSVYRFKGNVPNYASLPTTGLTIGDVYNALDTDINWAWTGTVWDNIGGTVDVSGKEDKSNKQNSLLPDGTGQKYVTVDAVNAGNLLKLDKGTYTGTAQDLKTDIDNIYVPDTLISAVNPTRSVNTFTFPSLGYQWLISKQLKTNAAQFITTISVASTIDHKRVDVIYGKADGTLGIQIGIESISVAPVPTKLANTVQIFFINIFGNTIDAPTPITNDISVQDIFGTEQFKVSDYVRFEGVSFNTSQKLISINPLVPLSAFLDIVNGDDVTGAIENSKKPFKTIEKLLNSLPITTGETYTIYITGGTVPIKRQIKGRNLNFVAYSSVTLDFTNCMLSDGVTNATEVFLSPIGRLNFSNTNISIISNYVGQKTLTYAGGQTGFALTGYIETFNWKSVGVLSSRGTVLADGSDLIINRLYDSPQNTVIFSEPTNYNLVINNYYNQYRRSLFGTAGGSMTVNIKNIIGVGSSTAMLIISNVFSLMVGNVSNLNATLQIQASNSLTFYGTVVDTCTLDFLNCPLITGSIKSNSYHTNSYCQITQTFKNFTGKLSNISIVTNGKVVFDNCQINTIGKLVDKYYLSPGYVANSSRDDIIDILGGTIILQDDISTTILDLFNSNSNPTLPATKTILVKDYGFLKTNVLTLGKNVDHSYITASFKEKTKEVVIRSKYDLINRVLDSTITYVIDSSIILLSGEFISIPAGGLTLIGYGFNTSKITKNVAGQYIFQSASGGSGDFVTRDIVYNSGAGSFCNITDVDGTHAIEINDVNFNNCASLGTISGYRQFTGQTVGVYVCSDGLTLSGTWNGFSMAKMHVRNFATTGTLFKKGTGVTFSNRFSLSVNISSATGYKLLDFDNTMFLKDKTLQLSDCTVEVSGVISSSNTSSLIPNISPNDPKCKWYDSEGITLTALEFLDMKSPDGNIWRVEVSNAGVLTVTAI